MRVSVPKKVVRAKAVHLLPFSIVPQDGAAMQEARVSDYFLVSEALVASFRGREVRGAALRVPEGFVGAVAMVAPREKKREKREEEEEEEEEQEEEEEEEKDKAYKKMKTERTGQVKQTFDSLIVWEHDAAPMPETDNVFEWMKWPKLASAIHAPIELEKIESRKEAEPALE